MKGHVAVIYNLKDYDNSMTENVISLSAAQAANGQWHSLSVKRIGRWFQLKMDNGEGRNYNETWGSLQDSQFFNLKRDRIVSGSMVKFRPNANFHSKDLRDSKSVILLLIYCIDRMCNQKEHVHVYENMYF